MGGVSTITTTSDSLTVAFQTLWAQIGSAVPTLIVALVVFSLGLLVAEALGRVAAKVIQLTKVDVLVEKLAAVIKLQTLGMKFSFSKTIGWMVKWFFVVVVFIAVADILHLAQVTNFLRQVALYVPNVLVAVVLLTIGLVVGKFVHDVVARGVQSSHMPSAAGSLAMMAEWGVIVFAVMAALTQLGIAAQLIQILFTGVIFGLSVAFGLAFGLGGKDKAREWLEKMSRDMMK